MREREREREGGREGGREREREREREASHIQRTIWIRRLLFFLVNTGFGVFPASTSSLCLRACVRVRARVCVLWMQKEYKNNNKFTIIK